MPLIEWILDLDSSKWSKNPLLMIGNQYGIKPLIRANRCINRTWSQSWSFVIWKKETKYYWPPHKASKLCWPFILGWSFETCMMINQTKNQWRLYKASKLWLSLKLGRGRKEGYGWYTPNMHVLLFVPHLITLCTHATNVQIHDRSSA